MIELKIAPEVRDGHSGFTCNRKLKGKPGDLLEELAYGVLNVTKSIDPDKGLETFLKMLLLIKMIPD